MPIPDLSVLCVELLVTPGELCITMPVGIDLCVQFPSIIPPTPDELVKQLFGMLNSAMAPLQPIFNILDAVVAVFECIKAISTLNPKEILECIPLLAEKVMALLKLLPQLSIPLLIVGFLDVLILYLQGQANQLRRWQDHLEQILDAYTLSQQPGNAGLALVVDCANAEVDAFFAFLNETNAPLNRLIGFVNFFLQLIGVKQCIPTLGEFVPDQVETIIWLLEQLIKVLELLRNLIPAPGGAFPFGDPNDPQCGGESYTEFLPEPSP